MWAVDADRYFLQKIGGIEYIHILDLAPTKDILDAYKKKEITWDSYEQKFNQLITQRQIERKLSIDIIDKSCLLCSELKPHNCHRRLVAEYLQINLEKNIKIHHL